MDDGMQDYYDQIAVEAFACYKVTILDDQGSVVVPPWYKEARERLKESKGAEFVDGLWAKYEAAAPKENEDAI